MKHSYLTKQKQDLVKNCFKGIRIKKKKKKIISLNSLSVKKNWLIIFMVNSLLLSAICFVNKTRAIKITSSLVFNVLLFTSHLHFESHLQSRGGGQDQFWKLLLEIESITFHGRNFQHSDTESALQFNSFVENQKQEYNLLNCDNSFLNEIWMFSL